MIEAPFILVIAIIIIALIFDFTNGFHDSANSISTVVSTKVLSPRNAVVFAAFFNFIAAFGFGVAVASTISKIIELEVVDTVMIPYIILAALAGAIIWNIITWFFGLPTSSSHALIGGIVGAGISAAGLVAIKWSTVELVAIFMILSPLIGFAIGFLFMALVLNITKNAHKSTAETHFKRLQLCSAAAYSFSHGTNDAQKTMGIIVPLLFSIGYFGVAADPNNLPVPLWVILIAHAAIALGTLF
ncbi:MAG: inorganic phosphate transporter, partial [Methanoregula sp.]|nr:inorganic phosphate transporter [Methanoregula sp.]